MANFHILTSYATTVYDHLNIIHYENISSLSIINETNNFISINTKNKLNWPVLILSILSIFGIVGNLLVCASISLDKQLQTVTNFFLFSLAIADCLLSLVVLPLAIIKDFQGSWQLPMVICNIYVFLDVLLCTTSIWHLTIVSIDRFLYISRPFRSREQSKFKTFCIIILIWTFSIGISCTILILGFADQRNILVIDNHKRLCALNNNSFIIFGSIICFCIPCVLMVVTYSLTIRRLQQQAAKYYSDPDDHSMMMSQATHRLRRHKSTSKVRSSSSSSPRNYQKTLIKDTSNSTSIPTPSSSHSAALIETDNKSNHLEWPKSSRSSLNSSTSNTNQRSFLHSTFVQKAFHAFKGGTETTSERRAMKVLGIVFFVFLVAWLPFSILNILAVVCPSCGIQPSLLNLTSWLGYISSNLNPIIYTAFNVRFRRAFVSILTCQLNYFSHKRKRNNLYIFIASNNNQISMSTEQRQRFFSLRRLPKKRNSFT
ncbi:unnamed protein product [Rotaria sordida]|uniref:G-protein coupled receptors family 1 profile domain-containing protein n=1 Tax=Rotaria sordida TaxID=392033 RepID=A0A814P6Y1_9BILA|nr:unnamed protein product [Rotaria sordida]CAF1102280.1 unnamed protein product [Rotaria sordida]CAF1309044.1 unnamed protein product [Rotaria sordida]CAF1317109.1 unnamed protein product [Rotaria sordida]CAF3863468.1 unnamed protein product [Rotaria sordida]